jgi:hypothetical protein
MPKNALESMMQVTTPEEAQFVNKLFPKDYRMLKMVHEVQPDLVFSTAVLGTVQRIFKSKTLKVFDEEWMLRVKSKDRKGETVLVEYGMSMRQSVPED